MKCRTAIIGAGYMAVEHIRAFQDVQGVEISGIHSRTRGRAQEVAARFQIPNVCDSIPELHATTGANLVVVAVPELELNGVSRTCFQFPWTILLEKPAGYNLADADAIERAASASRAKAFVALNRRHMASTQAVLSDLRNLSGQRFIRVRDQEDPASALAAGQPQTVVDNWMYANSIHIIDYFLLLGRGRITSVTPIVPWNHGRSPYVAARVLFESGDIGLYEGIWGGPGPWAVGVSTPEKYWELRPLEQAASQAPKQRRLEIVEGHSWDTHFKPGLRLQAEKAAAAAQGGITDLPTLHQAMETMRLIHAIFA